MKKNLEYRIKILLFSLFLFVPFLTNATAQSEIVISLDFANAPLSEVLNEISRQTSLSMVYNAKDVDPNRKVTIHANREKLSKVMTDLLKNTNTTYSVRDNHLVVYSTKETPTVHSTMQQKQRTIKGTVSDEYGEPLIGVSVLVQGTTTGTITDIDGNYTLEILNDEAVLEFSYIGYQKISLRVAGASSFNIIMKEDAQQLVVTAMGIERKEKSLTYATQQVKGDELMKVQDANFVNALSGKASGVTITPSAGGAGGASGKSFPEPGVHWIFISRDFHGVWIRQPGYGTIFAVAALYPCQYVPVSVIHCRAGVFRQARMDSSGRRKACVCPFHNHVHAVGNRYHRSGHYVQNHGRNRADQRAGGRNSKGTW